MDIETGKKRWHPAPVDKKRSARHWDGYAKSFATKAANGGRQSDAAYHQ